MGNPLQLTSPVRRLLGRRYRAVVFALGTMSMLLITLVASLACWIALPWAFLGWSPTLVTSGSMTPVLTPGDVVMVRPARHDELAAHTVVLYDRPDTGPILHRIVAELPDGRFRTQGDANPSPDSEPVRMSDIRGVAVLAIPSVGQPSLWLHDGQIPLVVAAGLAVLVLVALAPRAFDPAFDPWAGTARISPVEILLGRAEGSPANRGGQTGSELLPDALRGVVLDRLAAQGTTVRLRAARLLEGLA